MVDWSPPQIAQDECQALLSARKNLNRDYVKATETWLPKPEKGKAIWKMDLTSYTQHIDYTGAGHTSNDLQRMIQ